MSGQQEIIPTGKWRKVYSFCHASINVSLGLHKLNITLTLLPHTPDCDSEINKDTLDNTVLHSYNDDTVLNKDAQQVLR